MNKKIIIWSVVILIGIIIAILVFRVIVKIRQESQKPIQVIFNVKAVKAGKTLWKEFIKAEAIVQGDPQVLVYPNNVNGIFMYNNVKEGDHVYKDEDIAFIDRNIPGEQYQPAPVKSPINGIVIKLYFIDRGQSVSVQQPVAEIANPNRLKVVVTLGEADLLKVKSGQPVTITSDYSKQINISDNIDAVTPYIDSDSFSGNVTIYIARPGPILKIGMTVNVEIEVAERMAYVVPEGTVLTGTDSEYIYTAGIDSRINASRFSTQITDKLKNRSGDMNLILTFYKPDKDRKNYILSDQVDEEAKKKIIDIFNSIDYHLVARQVNIQTGYSTNGMVEITGGFSDGDYIITDGNFKLYDGALIRFPQSNAGK